MKKTIRIAAGVVFCCYTAVAAEAPAPHFTIANRIHVTGDGGWDLLASDDASGKLYLSHSTAVDVVDTKAGKQIGTIPDTNGVHGIAIANDEKKGFITCGRENDVAVFDLDSLKVVAHVETGKNPDSIIYEPETHRVFAFNGHSASATVIDAKTNAVAGTIDLGGKPELPAVDGKGTVFVNLEDKSKVVEIGAKTLKVKNTWSIAPGEEPTGLALDPVNHRLFIGCANKMMVIMDSKTGKVIGTKPVGEHVDGAGFDPGLKCAYTSNGDGTLTVVQEVDPTTFKVVENTLTQRGARTMAVNLLTHHIYLPVAELGPMPPPTAERRRRRPPIVPGTFTVLDLAPAK